MTSPPPIIQPSSSSHPSGIFGCVTPQKSISRQLRSRPFKNYLSNCGIVAIGLTVDARAMGSASSTMIVSGAARDVRSRELQDADLQFGPLSD